MRGAVIQIEAEGTFASVDDAGNINDGYLETIHGSGFIIDPSGKSLYTIEIGINPQYYEKYVKFKYGMPYPSILRYSLPELNLEK